MHGSRVGRFRTRCVGMLVLGGLLSVWCGAGSAFAEEKPVFLKDIGDYPEQLTVAGDTLYFTAGSRDSEWTEPVLWKTDGTAEGTQIVKGSLDNPNEDESPKLSEKIETNKSDMPRTLTSKTSTTPENVDEDRTNSKSNRPYSSKTIAIVKRVQGHGCGFYPIYDTLGPEATNELHLMLNDVDYAENWFEIAQIIGYISNNPNTSVHIIGEYIQRVESSKIFKNNPDKIVAGKIAAISALGWLGGEEADKMLQFFFTPEGAEETLRLWRSYFETDKGQRRFEELEEFLYAMTVEGLERSGSPKNISIIEAEYHRLDNLMRQKPEDFWLSGNRTHEDSKLEQKYVSTLCVLCERDAIKEIGRDRYQRLSDEEQVSYCHKYMCDYNYIKKNCE